jgi:hypothetical protein
MPRRTVSRVKSGWQERWNCEIMDVEEKYTTQMDNQPNQCVAMNIHIVRSKITSLPNRPMWHHDDIEAEHFYSR